MGRNTPRAAVRPPRAGSAWHDFAPVFPRPDGSPWGEAVLLNRRFRPFLKRAGLPEHFTLYSLRYTHATLQLLAGGATRW